MQAFTCEICGADSERRDARQHACPECRREWTLRQERLRTKRRTPEDRARIAARTRELARKGPRCSYEGCPNAKAYATGLCRSHHSRLVRTGTPDGLIQRRKRESVTSDGYRRRTIDGKHQLEHRVVMAQVMGRPLLATENVHHINGDKLDNRPENLEIWNTHQPAGQRVPDKVAWALELLELYAPEELSRNSLLAVSA